MKMITILVWNLWTLRMMRRKKTKMLLEQQLLLKYQLMRQAKKFESGDNTSIHSREDEQVEKEGK